MFDKLTIQLPKYGHLIVFRIIYFLLLSINGPSMDIWHTTFSIKIRIDLITNRQPISHIFFYFFETFKMCIIDVLDDRFAVLQNIIIW